MISASPGLRFLAWTIDMMIMLTLYLVLVYIVVQADTVASILSTSLNVILFVAFVLTVAIPVFYLVTTSRFGGTPGKLCTGILVVDEKGKFVTLKTAFYREFVGKFASGSFLMLGYFWVLKDPNHRTWHDMVAGTHVINKPHAQHALGLISLVALIVINIYLGNHINTMVKTHMPLYQGIYSELQYLYSRYSDESEENLADPTPTPTPQHRQL